MTADKNKAPTPLESLEAVGEAAGPGTVAFHAWRAVEECEAADSSDISGSDASVAMSTASIAHALAAIALAHMVSIAALQGYSGGATLAEGEGPKS